MNSPKVGFVSLGCPKALVDSERILTQLRTDGYQIAPSYDGADVVVVNTCGFIDSARAESLDAIGEALNENGRVIVTGCMGVDENEIRALHPSVLSVSGPQQYEQVVSAVHQYAPFEKDHEPFIDLVPPQGVKLTPRAGDVLSEAERLVDAGVKELLVISQDTSAYGIDLKYRLDFWGGKPVKTRMTELCRELGSLGAWVRLHYVYPYPHVDELIPLMAEGLVLPYLDIPLQHGSPRILKLMKRPAAAENALKRIRAWREICPDITLRSTFIVGFPSETDDDFKQLLDFINEAQLDRVGCFQYSPVDGARANALPDHVPADVMAEREQVFMQLQAEISRNRLQAKVDSVQQVLVDSVDEHGAIARSSADAPEIDGQVYVLDGQHLQAGDLVDVKISEADEYDLNAYLCN